MVDNTGDPDYIHRMQNISHTYKATATGDCAVCTLSRPAHNTAQSQLKYNNAWYAQVAAEQTARTNEQVARQSARLAAEGHAECVSEGFVTEDGVLLCDNCGKPDAQAARVRLQKSRRRNDSLQAARPFIALLSKTLDAARAAQG